MAPRLEGEPQRRGGRFRPATGLKLSHGQTNQVKSVEWDNKLQTACKKIPGSQPPEEKLFEYLYDESGTRALTASNNGSGDEMSGVRLTQTGNRDLLLD